jgi:ABC-type multidrug transport system fused ATPase/permease subunit
MSSRRIRKQSVRGIRRAWALIGQRERKRMFRVAIYGVAIAGLDTIALLLIYALVNLLNDQPVLGVAGRIIGSNPGTDHYRLALTLLAVTAGLFIGRSLLSVLVLWLSTSAGNAAQEELLSRLLIGHARAPHLMRLERNSSETLRTVLGSVDQMVYGIVASSVSLVANLAVVLAVAVGLILASPLVAVAVTVYFFLIAFAWARGVRNALRRRGERVQALSEERYRMVMQGIAAAKELQLRGRSLLYAEGAISRTRGINAATRGANVANGSLRYLLEASLVVGAVLVVLVAGATGGRDTVLPAVGLVLAGAFRLLPALNQILFLSNQVQFATPATELVEHELRTFGSYADPSVHVASGPLRFSDGLEADDVVFQYATRTEPALCGVGFVLRPGETLGIIGPTGSGKSTLLDVVLGMIEPDAGSVTVDGVPLADCRDGWQRSIGYVPQDVYLVDDTLRANVALGWLGEEIDDGRVVEAIHLAGLDDVVADLPDGLQTVVGERGVRLSGGQRQRVGLARALYVQPSVLVLDEATSNLDQATEHRIVETLAALRGGVTMVVVTHRIASVRHCDRLLYLDRGAVRAEGTLDEVRAQVPGFEGLPVIPLPAVQVG